MSQVTFSYPYIFCFIIFLLRDDDEGCFGRPRWEADRVIGSRFERACLSVAHLNITKPHI